MLIPFKDRGYDFNGADCWGLYRLVRGTELGHWVDKYEEVASVADLRTINKILRHESTTPRVRPLDGGAQIIWKPIPDEEVRPFDLVLMSGIFKDGDSVRRAPVHVGVLVDDGLVLHIEEGRNAECVAYKPIPGRTIHPVLRNRIVGFYRPVEG